MQIVLPLFVIFRYLYKNRIFARGCPSESAASGIRAMQIVLPPFCYPPLSVTKTFFLCVCVMTVRGRPLPCGREEGAYHPRE